MNLFKIYLDDIKKKIFRNKTIFNIKSQNDLKNIILENPPDEFDFDLSTNAAMILSKFARENPKIIADKLKEILLKNIKDFSFIDIAGPGFLNIRLESNAWLKMINSIGKSKNKYGSNNQKKKI